MGPYWNYLKFKLHMHIYIGIGDRIKRNSSVKK